MWSSIRPRIFRPGAETVILDEDRKATSYPVEGYDIQEGFFDFMGIRVVRGRSFNAQDDAVSQPVVIINEIAAQQLWPGVDPIGRRFRLGPREEAKPWMVVVGVARNSQPIATVATYLSAMDEQKVFPLMWRPLSQVSARHMMVGVRAAPDRAPEMDGLKLYPAEDRKELPPFELLRSQMLNQWPFPQIRASARLMAVWSLYGALLAVVGVAALAHDAVKRRAREIGIRMALGADSSRITRMFLRDALALAILACVAAGIVWFSAASLIAKFVFAETRANRGGLLLGISHNDPIVIAVAVGLVVCTVLATLVPALNAARIDPAVSTRSL